MSIVPKFLRLLLGTDPEQLKAEERFRKSLKLSEESEAKLDDILGDLKRINKKAKSHTLANRTLLPDSLSPPVEPTSNTG